MAKDNSPLKFLEQASQFREEEVVIEFAVDRFQHFVCVKITLFLAIASKITEILNGNLTCHGEFDTGKGQKYFNAFANAYCWESPYIISEPTRYSSPNPNVLSNPSTVTNALRWLPYYLLVKALLFAIPSAYWHYRIGGRLTGHLNFIKLLISEAAILVKCLPSALPNSMERHFEPVAELDGHERFNNNRKTRAVRASAEKENKSTIDDLYDDDLTKCKSLPNAESIDEKPVNDDSFDPEVTTGPGKGKLLDRHFFSMLCYENFAALHHLLYFKSTCKATFFAVRNDGDGRCPLTQGIIWQWCHKDNFSGRFLVSRYYIRHAIAILLALAALRFSAFILELLGSDLWRYDSFRCQVLSYEDRDVLCTLHRRSLMLALLIMDVGITVFCLIVSIWQLGYVTTNRQRQSSCLFENLDDGGSVAMLAAMRKRFEDLVK